MALVYLVRHGQASFGGEDYDRLSELGARQSRLLGDTLRARGLGVDVAVSGTLARQRDTAAAALPGLAPVPGDPRWDEYDHHALVPDPPPTSREFQEALDGALAGWVATPAFAAFQDGATQALREVVGGLGRGATAVVVTSAGAISAVCARLLGGGPEVFLAFNRVLVNASLTKLVVGRSGVSLVSFNDHAHFEGEHRELLSYR